MLFSQSLVRIIQMFTHAHLVSKSVLRRSTSHWPEVRASSHRVDILILPRVRRKILDPLVLLPCVRSQPFVGRCRFLSVRFVHLAHRRVIGACDDRLCCFCLLCNQPWLEGTLLINAGLVHFLLSFLSLLGVFVELYEFKVLLA